MAKLRCLCLGSPVSYLGCKSKLVFAPRTVQWVHPSPANPPTPHLSGRSVKAVATCPTGAFAVYHKKNQKAVGGRQSRMRKGGRGMIKLEVEA